MSADYTVEADIHVASGLMGDSAGVIGRGNTFVGTGYLARYDASAGRWTLLRGVGNGSLGTLGSFPQALTANATYRLALDMTGTRIRLLVDGVERISVTDNSITAAGRGGVLLGFGSGATSVTATTGMHLDSFRISPPRVLDGNGTNHGSFFEDVTLGEVGAIAGDTDTAATFDGADDYATVARQVSGNFSIELWFRSTQGMGGGSAWTDGAGMVDSNLSGINNDFGISLLADGRVAAGVGGGGNGDISVTSTAGKNDGNWHHVVFTRDRWPGTFVLYVDGVAVGTASNNTLSLTSQQMLSFGRLASGGNHYQGSLDEIAIYDEVLSSETVTEHFDAGR